MPLAVSAQNAASLDQTAEAAILRVATDEGLTGVAEINHAPRTVVSLAQSQASSAQTRGLTDILVGRDPRAVRDLRHELIEGNQSSCRRGLGLALLNAVDVALWDLAAQAEDVALWRLLWGENARSPEIYATLYTGPARYADAVERLGEMVERLAAVEISAVKVEPLTDCVPEEKVADFVAEGRALVGEDAPLLVDVYQRYPTADRAAGALAEMAPSRPLLLETPLPIDDLAEHARLAELTDVPIAAAELYESEMEFKALIDFGRVDVVQPWPNRVGVSGALRVIEHAHRAGRRVIFGGWNATPIGELLGLHLAAGLPEGLALEHAPTTVYDDGFPLRRIGSPCPSPRTGRLPLPSAPGLGVVLDEELVAFHAKLARS